jgi:hypothetical protein
MEIHKNAFSGYLTFFLITYLSVFQVSIFSQIWDRCYDFLNIFAENCDHNINPCMDLRVLPIKHKQREQNQNNNIFYPNKTQMTISKLDP